METPDRMPVPGERYRLRPMRMVPGAGTLCPHCKPEPLTTRPESLRAIDGREVEVMETEAETTCKICGGRWPRDPDMVAVRIRLDHLGLTVVQVPAYCLEPIHETPEEA